MSITYPLAMPSTPGMVSVSWRLSRIVSKAKSPFSAKEQVYLHGGAFWEASLELPSMVRANWAEWEGFLDSLRGGYGTFLLTPPHAKTARGTATGTPLCNGAGTAGATTLATDGWTINITGILKRGDFFQIGTGSTSELKRIVTDANSNGSGESTLEFEPPIRTAPANNDAIVVTNPKGVFRLADDMTESVHGLAGISTISFSAVEAIR